MTDTQILSPDDTGEIRRVDDLGGTTQALNDYVITSPFPIVIPRKEFDETRVIALPQTIGDFTPTAPPKPTLPPEPAPEPAPMPVDTLPVPQPTDPRPVPNPAPAPVLDLGALQPIAPLERVLTLADAPAAYVGRRRSADDQPASVPPGRYGWLKSVLAVAWARVRSSM